MKIKKMNKKGFTLMEIILVVAIIVILTGLVGGLTISQIKQYQEFNDYAKEHFGANWEKEARLQVENMMKHPSGGEGGSGDEGSGGAVGETPAERDARLRAEIQALKDRGVTDDEIHITYDGDGYINGYSYSHTDTNGNGGGSQEVDPENNDDPTPTPKPTNTPTPVPTNTPVPTKAPTNTNIQEGTITNGTTLDARPDNGSGYNGDITVKLDNSVKNAKTLTITFTYTGTIDKVENFGALGDHAPAVNISNGTVTLTFDVAGMADWQKGNLMSLNPQFRNNSGGNFTVQLTGVETT